MNRYILSDLGKSFTYRYVKKTCHYIMIPNQSYVIGNRPINEMKIFMNLEDCLKFMNQNFQNYFGYKLKYDRDYQKHMMEFDLSILSQKINQYKKITLPCPIRNENSLIKKNGGYYGYFDGPFFYVDKITQIYGDY